MGVGSIHEQAIENPDLKEKNNWGPGHTIKGEIIDYSVKYLL